MNMVRIDVSRRWADSQINATLVLTSPRDLTPEEMLARFRRATSQWLMNCEAGKQAWEASRRNFNYGDFREHGVSEDPDFIRFLEANGLESAKVVGQDSIDLGETFDSVIYPET